MHPRIVVFAIVGVMTDLMCLLGAGAMMLTNNLWLQQVGPARFGLVTFVAAIAVVPILYGRERLLVAELVERLPKRKPATRPKPEFELDGTIRVT